jgi:hypothetical protein
MHIILNSYGLSAKRKGVDYSYFNACTGIIVAALKAGYKPESMPINVENIRAKIGSHTGV